MSQQLVRPEGRTSVGGSVGIFTFLFAVALVVVPIVLPAVGVDIPLPSRLLLMVTGLLLLLLALVVTIITRLYLRAPADEAFVRTGMGGAAAIIDGGALVIPVVHDMIRIPLQTMRFKVIRQGHDALITKDSLRADVIAEFFVRVPKETQAVLTAATSLGRKATDPGVVQELLQEKLESALRQVAAEMELTELLANRAEFIERVSGHVQGDIARNGLQLESVTISRLDQANWEAFQAESNIFDAKGAARAAAIIAEEKVRRNQAQLAAERAVREEQVRTQQALAQQDVLEATAKAQRDREIAEAQAMAERQAKTVAAEQARIAGLAEVERDQALHVAAVAREQAVAVANQQRDQAEETAEIARQRAVEVAAREKEIAVAEAERARAEAEAQQLAAQAERERQAQAVKTVEVRAEAERAGDQQVIAAQAEAEKRRVQEQVVADTAAYAVTRGAEARQEAAQREAEAIRIRAQAEADAKMVEAQGARAAALVPVEVGREQVNVEAARVDVLRRELESKAEFEKISVDLQVDLARIEAEKAARIAQAEAVGRALASARMTVWGDPDALSRMTQSFFLGQQGSMVLNGLSATAPDGLKAAAGGVGLVLARALKEKLGIDIGPAEIEALLHPGNGAEPPAADTTGLARPADPAP